jgi:hypothetical protein
MATLARTQIPYVEHFSDERVVTRRVPCNFELLLLLRKAAPSGMDRNSLGRSSKSSAASVTRALQQLSKTRFVHQVRDGRFHITGPGEQHLAQLLANEIGPTK